MRRRSASRSVGDRRRVGFACALLVVLLGACGGKAVFRLSSTENDAAALSQALGRRQLPAVATPLGGRPRVFAVTGGASGSAPAGSLSRIIAFDLERGSALWQVDADVRSRIAVGGDFIVALEGTQLVARDHTRGAPRWRTSIGGRLIGLAADRERAYVVYQDGSTWWLAAHAGSSGERLWKADAAGELGAPAAHGGVVYMPFLRQWLSIVDGKTGAQLTRVRGIDEQISMLQVTSRRAYYGSRVGVFLLDARSASGKRADATYSAVVIPPQLAGTTYGADVYDPIERTYSAADRKRVLWSSSGAATATEGEPLAEGFAVHYFRYLLGFDPGGALRWAYNHPRSELVASVHTGDVIAGVSASGEIVAIDPRTGGVRTRHRLGTTAPILGATFDADGWAPPGTAEPSDAITVLVSIVRDREARFERVKELAIELLARRPAPEVTAHLLGVLADPRQSAQVKDAVVAGLVARRDPASLPLLTAQLEVHTDFLTGTRPESLGAVAQAIGALAGGRLDADLRATALAALHAHLDAPATPTSDLVSVIGAMAAIGGAAAQPALGSHLLLYHATDELGGEPAWHEAIVDALATAGPAPRELLRHVAADPRTRPGLARTIRETLAD